MIALKGFPLSPAHHFLSTGLSILLEYCNQNPPFAFTVGESCLLTHLALNPNLLCLRFFAQFPKSKIFILEIVPRATLTEIKPVM